MNSVGLCSQCHIFFIFIDVLSIFSLSFVMFSCFYPYITLLYKKAFTVYSNLISLFSERLVFLLCLHMALYNTLCSSSLLFVFAPTWALLKLSSHLFFSLLPLFHHLTWSNIFFFTPSKYNAISKLVLLCICFPHSHHCLILELYLYWQSKQPLHNCTLPFIIIIFSLFCG